MLPERLKPQPPAGRPARWPVGQALVTGLSLSVTLAAVAGLAHVVRQPLLIPPLGATGTLILTAPDRPIAQPRSILGGYLIGVGVALAACAWLEPTGLVIALAAGVALALMLATDTLHPPGGAALMLLMLAPARPAGALVCGSVLAGVAVVVAVGWLVHRAVGGRRYPARGWW